MHTTMTEFFALANLWPVFLSIVGLVVWLSQIRSKVLELDREFEILRTKHEALDSKTLEILAEIREKLARIEGQLSISGHQ